MFAILRRLVVLGLITSSSVVFWEASELHRQLRPAEPPAPQAAPSIPLVESPSPAALVPGTSGQRFLAWALFVLLLPIVTAAVAGRVLRQESNTANLVLLFGYTGLDVLAAYLVGGLRVGGLLSGIAYLIGLLAVFCYNAWICSLLVRLQEP